eukprot:332825_1
MEKCPNNLLCSEKIDSLLKYLAHVDRKLSDGNSTRKLPSNHLILRQFLTPKDVNDFLELASPLYPEHAHQGIVDNDKIQETMENDNDPTDSSSPVKWINIRGRGNHTIYNEVLHLFLLCRGVYSRCKQHGRQFASSIVERKNYRSPYVFTNLYEKDKYHGIGFHKDDVDLFTMVILLTDDYLHVTQTRIGSLYIRHIKCSNFNFFHHLIVWIFMVDMII